MDNYEIADQLSLLSKLMDIHGENEFKAKSYASAAFNIEKLPQQLASLPKEKIFSQKGIGESVGNKILELITTKQISSLQELIKKTPEGVLDMLAIKGLGPKKINTIWKEMNIDSVQSLKLACEKNRLAEKKGFGEKTQQKVLEAINFQQQNAGSYLYAQVEELAQTLTAKIQAKFPQEKIEIAGTFRRQMETINELEWVTTIDKNDIKNFLVSETIILKQEDEDGIILRTEDILDLQFWCTDQEHFYQVLFDKSGSEEFLAAWKNKAQTKEFVASEEEIFSNVSVAYIPPFLREKKEIIEIAERNKLPEFIKTENIKSLIHSHSNWSDGVNTIEEMAKSLINLGFEYLVLSDHSKAAFYAGGLSEQKIIEQHALIDELNKRFAPFKIFKSIECDILGDGSLDYSNDVLASFDLVITSIHSNLQMTEEKAMTRLLGAIANPYTTILGHMTGRRLLQRPSYPVNHQTIIDACAEHKVVIEINAHPERLDMDWRWIDYALQKDVLLSINPDAHSVDQFKNIKYGVLAAQKGGLTKEKNVSSFSLNEFENFLKNRKANT